MVILSKVELRRAVRALMALLQRGAFKDQKSCFFPKRLIKHRWQIDGHEIKQVKVFR